LTVSGSPRSEPGTAAVRATTNPRAANDTCPPVVSKPAATMSSETNSCQWARFPTAKNVCTAAAEKSQQARGEALNISTPEMSASS
jgi:hypothetical protein